MKYNKITKSNSKKTEVKESGSRTPLLDSIVNGYFPGHCDWNKFGQTTMTTNSYNIYMNCDRKIAQFEEIVKNWKKLKEEAKSNILGMFTKDELIEYLNNL